MSHKATKTGVGSIHMNMSGYQYQIIADLGGSQRRIKFLDEFGWETVVSASNAGSGSCGNLYARSMKGVGYFGEGPFNSLNSPKQYRLWFSMFSRCYGSAQLELKPSYKDKSVYEEWHNFQSFAAWCLKEHGFGYEGWELDKDILVQGNKIYSPPTCCFVPKELNVAFVGVGKRAKKYDLPLGITMDKGSGKFLVQGTGAKKIGRFHNLQDAIFAYKEYREAYMKDLAEKYKDVVADKFYLAVASYKETSGDNYGL